MEQVVLRQEMIAQAEMVAEVKTLTLKHEGLEFTKLTNN